MVIIFVSFLRDFMWIKRKNSVFHFLFYVSLYFSFQEVTNVDLDVHRIGRSWVVLAWTIALQLSKSSATIYLVVFSPFQQGTPSSFFTSLSNSFYKNIENKEFKLCVEKWFLSFFSFSDSQVIFSGNSPSHLLLKRLVSVIYYDIKRYVMTKEVSNVVDMSACSCAIRIKPIIKSSAVVEFNM